ncbi:nischarin/ IRAS/ imidazoline receptor [Ectocarpus siliculosus]|uniref:Nischarin/ IRAS/ imidazoline receptor n=1 Tax=Ectocarpus siliculosus TaxID=2880 RepID=D8LMA8_ECTSI|nr:nischarin/ IRAS/ imidazoline receptor [Ectocarpus siliculosus]|eukprot:CBN77518.1 nischarin/ IRAS/ imidazoline receptor [Ectocarpus siliculosus]
MLTSLLSRPPSVVFRAQATSRKTYVRYRAAAVAGGTHLILCGSDFDPSGFDVGDDTWAWLLPVFSKKKEAPRPEKAAPSTGTPTTAPSPRPPPLTLSISTPWMWLSTPIDGGGGGFDLAMGATSPAAIPTVTPRTSPTTTSSSTPLVAGSNEGEASLSSRLSSVLGLGAAEVRDAVLQDDAWAEAELAELEILAEALGNPSPVPPTTQASSHTATPAVIATTIAGLSNGFGNSDDDDDESGGRMVQLDIPAVQALQRALQRGGFLTRGSQGLSVDSPYAFSEGGAGVGGRRPQRQSSGRSSLSVEGGTGAGGGYYSYAPGGGVMAYFDDGVDGDGRQRRSRLLLPAPPVGRHEAALVWKLFRLARDATALRVHRGTSRRASNWGQPVELQMFPALQELRLEAVPLEHVEGLFALRLQLKSLSFENAFLPSLLALLTPPEPASGSQDTPGGQGGHAALDTAADGGVPGPSIADSGGDVNKRDGSDSTPVGARTADSDRYRLSCKRGKIQQVRSLGGVASSRKALGVSRPAKPLAEWPGMGRLQSGLGMGTPMLHWSLLESLSICKCGLRELDPSLRLLPRVRRLSMAHNRLSRVDFFQDCGSLEVLDLSHNRLTSVENIHAVLGNLRSLKLRGNLIERTSGLEKLFSLEDVNLSDNRIEDLKEAARLSTLPMLRRVWLNGNPVEAEEGKDYRVSVLSLLYQGWGGELKGAAGRVSTMFAGGSGDGSGRETGIALDGRLPSRKELVQLSQLCFPRAAEVPFPTATDSALPSSDEHGSSRDGLPSRRHAPGSVVAARGRAEGTGKRRLSATAVQPAVGSSAASASRAAPDPSPSSSPSSRRRLSVSPPASRLPPPSPCVPLRLPAAQRRRRPARRSNNGVPAAGMPGQDPLDQQARRRRRSGTRSAMIEEAAPARAGGWGGGAGGEGNNRMVSLGTASWSSAAAAEAAELSSSLSALSLGLSAVPLPSEGGQQQPLLQPRETASTAVDPEVVPEAVCDDRDTTTATAAVEGGDSSGNERRSADMGRLAPRGAAGEAWGAAELARGDGGVVPAAAAAAAAVEALPERGEGSGELHPTAEDGGRGDLAVAAAAASPSSPDDFGGQRGGENDSRQGGDASPKSANGGTEGGQSVESSGNAGVFSVGVNPAPGWDLSPGRRGRPRSGGGREVAAGRASPFFPSPSPLPSPSRSPLRLLAAARQEEGGIRPPGVDGDVSGGGDGGERGSSEAEKNGMEGGGVEGGAEVGEGNEEEAGCGGVNGEEERGTRGSSSVEDEDAEHDCGYRGDEAYAELLVAEHLELYFRQQVFSGAAPYLLYDEERDGGGQQPEDLPRAMHRHREASKTRQEKKLVAMFRETALPCVPLSLRNQRHHSHHHHHFRVTTKEKRAARSWLRASWAPSPSPTVAGGVSGSGGGVAEGLSGTKTDESSNSYHGSGLESSMENALAATGMVQQVHRRGVDGEAEGYTMGEVACVVVATESSIFFVDGGFAKDGTQFSAAPRPRVLMVLPLACLERTTIGFRLQKLEMHFDPSAVGEQEEGWSDDGHRDETVSVSVALLTRDKSRTFNLLQTLEPLSTKARRRISLPAMVVENRDEATLEAIARALPPSTIASARHSTSRSQLGQASPPAFSPAGATTPAGESKAAQLSTNIEPDLPGHETAGLFGRLGKWGEDLGPAAAGDEDCRGGGVALGSVHGGGAVMDDGNGQGGREGDGDSSEVAGAGEGADAAETHDTASWDLVGAPPSLSGTVTPLPSPTVRGRNVVETPPSVLVRSGVDVGDGGGGHEGTVVVFQLLVQRWELRPWVVVPRTLVATKEKVVVDLKGERAFDPRRQWRLQCRTRGSAEGVASAVLRLSRERVQQQRQSSSWWKL